MSKKYNYKQLSATLKTMYVAKQRLLSFYKSVLSYTGPYTDAVENPLTGSELEVEKFVDKDMFATMNRLRKELRTIHLARAFIKGVPYSKIENNPEISAFYMQVEELLFSIQNVPSSMSKLMEEYEQWRQYDVPPSTFAKPVSVAQSIQEAFQAVANL